MANAEKAATASPPRGRGRDGADARRDGGGADVLGPRWPWIAAATVLIAPYAVLAGAGSWFLIREGWIWPWIGAATAMSLGAWWWLRALVRRRVRRIPALARPSERWPSAGRAAWEALSTLEGEIDRGEFGIDSPADIGPFAQRVLHLASQPFHPESKQPELEVTVPDLTRLMENVARDFGDAVLRYVPGSHILTINDLRGMGNLAKAGRRVYDVYRLASLATNPARAVVRELNSTLTGRLLTPALDDTRKELLKYLARKIGAYAIELHSGQTVLAEQSFREHVGRESARAQEVSERVEQRITAEPFRIIVTGQVNSGKSSLVNALLGRSRAVADPLARPERERFRAHAWNLADGEPVLLIDTDGLGGGSGENLEGDRIGIDEAARGADLLVLTVSAVSAAREEERRLLDALRDWARGDVRREAPPVLVVLTHPDRLRPFHEWAPPYDWRNAGSDATAPGSAKARSIAAAAAAVAADLGVPVGDVIPIRLDEGNAEDPARELIPAIEAKLRVEGHRLRLKRAIDDFRSGEVWEKLATQAGASAAAVGNLAGLALKRLVKKALDPGDPIRPPGSGPGDRRSR